MTCGSAGEVSVQFRRRRHDITGRRGRTQGFVFPAEEEEELVLQHRAAKVGAVLILVQRHFAQAGVVREPVIRIEGRIAEVFVRASMKLVGAALGGDLNDATSVATKLRADVVGRDPELLNDILRRNQGVHIVFCDVGANAVNEEKALPAECAADLIVSVGDRLGIGADLAGAAVGHGAA